MQNKKREKKSEKDIKQFISSRQISLIKMIVEMVESEKKDTETGRENGFCRCGESYYECDCNGFNSALDTISLKLKELTDCK